MSCNKNSSVKLARLPPENELNLTEKIGGINWSRKKHWCRETPPMRSNTDRQCRSGWCWKRGVGAVLVKMVGFSRWLSHSGGVFSGVRGVFEMFIAIARYSKKWYTISKILRGLPHSSVVCFVSKKARKTWQKKSHLCIVTKMGFFCYIISKNLFFWNAY